MTSRGGGDLGSKARYLKKKIRFNYNIVSNFIVYILELLFVYLCSAKIIHIIWFEYEKPIHRSRKQYWKHKKLIKQKQFIYQLLRVKYHLKLNKRTEPSPMWKKISQKLKMYFYFLLICVNKHTGQQMKLLLRALATNLNGSHWGSAG